tara:strand:- start:206 stop:1519 length:1314 start_codon:yes stop_codon:yes gene_type:complete
MATHDYVIANGTGSAVRSDINNVLAAIVSANSSSTEPSTKYAYQFWADTNSGYLKIRNAANNGWINLFKLDATLSDIPIEGTVVKSTGESGGTKFLREDGDNTCSWQTPALGYGFKNLVINGAMQVAQRGTSSTDTGMQTVDRHKFGFGGHDEALTQAQHALTSSDTGPWEKGFRNSYHITNGNQTGGATTADYAYFEYGIEAQDIANSGWDYTNTSSYLTLSYWVKSSVAQTFYGYIMTTDGSVQTFSISTGALSANTWKKVTVKIPGHANLQFDDNNDSGLTLYLWPWSGTNRTDSGNTLNAWQAYSSSNRMPDNTSTWWTTNDATIEITGIQLEVGDATDFEHRSYGEELARCQRYYSKSGEYLSSGYGSSDGYARGGFIYPVTMRASPTLTLDESGSGSIIASGGDQYCFYVTYGSLTGTGAGLFSYTASAEL